MPGKIKRMIDEIVAKRSKGNETIMFTTRTKLILKGIDPEDYSETTADDPDTVAKLKEIAETMGVTLRESA